MLECFEILGLIYPKVFLIYDKVFRQQWYSTKAS